MCSADSYIEGMEPFNHAERPLPQAQAAVASQTGYTSSSSPCDVRETRLIWTGAEGQIVNLWAFLVAVLLCWTFVPVIWAIYRYLKVTHHRWELTDQRLLEHSGILVKHIETLELYRVKDISVSGTLLQAAFGRGRIILQTTDVSTPTVVLNAIVNPRLVAQLMRDAVERCRMAKGVRAFDY